MNSPNNLFLSSMVGAAIILLTTGFCSGWVSGNAFALDGFSAWAGNLWSFFYGILLATMIHSYRVATLLLRHYTLEKTVEFYEVRNTKIRERLVLEIAARMENVFAESFISVYTVSDTNEGIRIRIGDEQKIVETIFPTNSVEVFYIDAALAICVQHWQLARENSDG